MIRISDTRSRSVSRVLICFLMGVLVAFRISTAQSAPSTTRADELLVPVPDPDAQAKAIRVIRDVFKAEYSDTSPDARRAFAANLLKRAQETTADPVSRFVLLREACDVAASAGDCKTAFEAVDEMGSTYNVPSAKMKLGAAQTSARVAANPDSSKRIAAAAMRLVGEACEAEDYGIALAAADVAESMATRAKDPAFILTVRARNQEVHQAQSQQRRARTASQLLREKPDDADGNSICGNYYCLWRGDWEAGLPMLAKGSEPVLRSAAQTDLSMPTSSNEQKELADTWWLLATQQKGMVARHLQARAAHWYERAAPGLSGIDKEVAMKRAAEHQEITQATSRAVLGQRVVDLLRLANPAQYSVQGKWALHDGVIESEGEGQDLLQFPYRPPEEYDYRVEFTRLSGDNCILLAMPKNQKPFIWVMGNGAYLFHYLKGGGDHSNRTVVRREKALENNRRYTALLQVRNDGVRSYLDGELLNDWKTDFRELIVRPWWLLRDASSVGVGTGQSKVIFHVIELVEVTGTGTEVTP